MPDCHICYRRFGGFYQVEFWRSGSAAMSPALKITCSAGPESSGLPARLRTQGGGSVTRGNKREQPDYKSARFEIVHPARSCCAGFPMKGRKPFVMLGCDILPDLRCCDIAGGIEDRQRPGPGKFQAESPALKITCSAALACELRIFLLLNFFG